MPVVVIVAYTGKATGGGEGEGGPLTPPPNTLLISKVLKGLHQAGQTFHKNYNYDMQFPLYFSYSFLLERDSTNSYSL